MLDVDVWVIFKGDVRYQCLVELPTDWTSLVIMRLILVITFREALSVGYGGLVSLTEPERLCIGGTR